jgi:hypothetical protein
MYMVQFPQRSPLRGVHWYWMRRSSFERLSRSIISPSFLPQTLRKLLKITTILFVYETVDVANTRRRAEWSCLSPTASAAGGKASATARVNAGQCLR